MSELLIRHLQAACWKAGRAFNPNMTLAEARALVLTRGLLTRQQVRQVHCPACGAKRDRFCVDPEGNFQARNHKQRVSAALDVQEDAER